MWCFSSSSLLNITQDTRAHARSQAVITILSIRDFYKDKLMFALKCSFFYLTITHDGFPWQHVREVCQFDLTCPIRGVGPEVVRKLLLEENLKIRGRKDSKVSGASALIYRSTQSLFFCLTFFSVPAHMVRCSWRWWRSSSQTFSWWPRSRRKESDWKWFDLLWPSTERFV